MPLPFIHPAPPEETFLKKYKNESGSEQAPVDPREVQELLDAIGELGEASKDMQTAFRLQQEAVSELSAIIQKLGPKFNSFIDWAEEAAVSSDPKIRRMALGVRNSLLRVPRDPEPPSHAGNSGCGCPLCSVLRLLS